MPVKAAPRTRYTKQKPSKHFLKVYLPYLPLAVSVVLSLLLSAYWHPFALKKNVLAYATNMSIGGLFEATNSERAASGSPALRLNDKLANAAQAKANDMAARNYWSHVTPDGKQPWYFFDQAGYKYQKAGENLAYGFDSSVAAINGWMNSPSHRENLLDSQFVDVGFGIANMADYQNTGPETIVVAEYGRPFSEAAPVTLVSPTTPTKPLPPTTLKVNQPVSPVTLGGKIIELPAQGISIAQSLTGGHAPWITFAVGSLMGGFAVFLLIKHGLALRRAFASSERFVLHHPLLDVTIVSYILLTYILVQNAGVIR